MKILSFEDRAAPFVESFRASAMAAGYDLLLGPPPPQDRAFAEFRSLYRHRSVNPPGFEMACFRRYFAAQNQVAPDERVIMADSDLLVGCPFDRLPYPVRMFDHGLVGSVGVADGIGEADISPHFSVWTGRLLRQFCDYLIESYRTGQDRLDAIHAQRAAAARRVAISDMTLLNLWVEDGKIAFHDSNRVSDGIHVDHNISTSECADARFRRAFGRKAVWRSGDGFGFVSADGQPVEAAVIHLQGRYKLGAPALADGRMTAFRAISAYIATARVARRFAMR